ncbi:UNVERIFIED_CONTAM: hypothetical protein PYX00_005785 [Menopon gallinae]|uniref:Large ribosomal subunit protein uL16m n=1 Tax=Menopon gallinae TaxID=328185 RepID=A0AAW2HSR9_9NEOP
MAKILRTNSAFIPAGSELLANFHLPLYFNKPQAASVKNYKPPVEFPEIIWPEKSARKLKTMPKAPTFFPPEKPRTMRRMIYLMRGPELVQNFLIHKQYGIQAVTGGRMKVCHFDFLQKAFNKILNKNTFAVWRVDEPWQAMSKKGSSKKMGGGKAPIHHYVTPVKAGRIILEFGGIMHPQEVWTRVAPLAENLPFPARFVSQELLEKEAEEEKRLEKANLNKYTMKYVILNNLGGCNNWLSPFDYLWFGKYR